MKIRLLLAALLVAGAAACTSATAPEPDTRAARAENGPLRTDSTAVSGGYGMGSGN